MYQRLKQMQTESLNLIKQKKKEIVRFEQGMVQVLVGVAEKNAEVSKRVNMNMNMIFIKEKTTN